MWQSRSYCQGPVGPNTVQDTQLDWPPTGIFNRTPTLSSTFSLDTVPTASTSTTITQPPLGPGAPTEQEGATITDPNWAQGWDVFYHNGELAPFTSEGSGPHPPHFGAIGLHGRVYSLVNIWTSFVSETNRTPAAMARYGRRLQQKAGKQNQPGDAIC